MYGLNLEGFQKYLTGIVAVNSPRGIVSSFAVLLSALLCGFNIHKDEFLMTNCTCHIYSLKEQYDFRQCEDATTTPITEDSSPSTSGSPTAAEKDILVRHLAFYLDNLSR